ncbi:MAG: endonuclease III domain-containing protein [Desulfobacteraceae bacterium]|nr:endonuclease III domain-containing protein [Desulfobacteraceae bacterium]
MNGRRQELLREIHDRLLAAFGPQSWWPAQSPFEVILGAILTQNTAWKNVVAAIRNLRENGLLSCERISALAAPELAQFIRPSGFFNQKAKKIRTFCDHIARSWDGDLESFLAQDTDPLRDELLQIRGIGPETADSIVLYAAFKPSFVVDAYTYRIFSRHDWIAEAIGYDELREHFMGALDPDVPLFQEFHALLVRTGHLYCRKKPLCEDCPLNYYFNSEENGCRPDRR